VCFAITNPLRPQTTGGTRSLSKAGGDKILPTRAEFRYAGEGKKKTWWKKFGKKRWKKINKNMVGKKLEKKPWWTKLWKKKAEKKSGKKHGGEKNWKKNHGGQVGKKWREYFFSKVLSTVVFFPAIV
jgi:hypothetical protein